MGGHKRNLHWSDHLSQDEEEIPKDNVPTAEMCLHGFFLLHIGGKVRTNNLNKLSSAPLILLLL